MTETNTTVSEGDNYNHVKLGLKVADLFLEYLSLEGVTKIFGIPGGAILHLEHKIAYPEQAEFKGRFTFVICRHEGGAAYIAHGHAIATDGLAVVLATTGPGAINALTAVINANECGVPLLMVTGEVPQKFFGRGYLQAGIDARLDVDAIYRNAVQSTGVVTSEANFATVLEKALRDARSIPGAAAHVTIPVDVGDEFVKTKRYTDATGLYKTLVPNSTERYRTLPRGTDTAKVGCAWEALAGARRPLFFLGNGCRAALRAPGRLDMFKALVEKFAIPVMTTPDGKGIFPESHDLSLRNHGMAGCHWPRAYMGLKTEEENEKPNFDALMVIGSSLGEFATSFSSTKLYGSELIPSDNFIQVDLRQDVIGRNYPVTLGIVGEAGATIDALCAAAEQSVPAPAVEARRAFIAGIKADPNSAFDNWSWRASIGPRINPAAMVAVIGEEVKEGHIFIDGGNCIGWSLNYMVIDPPVQYHSGLAMGAMGFAVGAVIGAKMGAPARPCVAITGDGAFLMHGAELSTAAAHNVGAVFVVLDDNDLGMVTQSMNHSFPEKVWRGQYSLGEPDLAKFSEGLGARAIVVDETQGIEDFRKALRLALRHADTENKPHVVVVKIDTTVEPPYGFGRIQDTTQP